jgi:O-antigen/teichoic acid export membrane protein
MLKPHWRRQVDSALRRARGDSARNTLILVPATVVPGAVAFAGMILIGQMSSLAIVGLLSLSRVAAGFGSAILAEAPSLAAQRSMAENKGDRSRAFRTAMLRRAALFVPGVVGIGALLALWKSDIGWPLAWGAILTVPEGLFVFEFGYLRYNERFRHASVLASVRAVAAWTAAVVIAGTTKSFLDVVVGYVGVTVIAGLVVQPPHFAAVDHRTREDLKKTWRSLSSYNLASYALNNGDQYVLGIIKGPGLVGVYSLGYVLGAGVVSLVAEPLIGVLGPRMIREWESPDDGPARAGSTALRGSVLLLVSGAILAVGLAVAGSSGLLRFVTKRAAIGGVAAIVAAAMTLHNASSLSFQSILYLRLKSALLSRAAWIAVAIAIPAIIGLTFALGVIGTALATLVAYLIMGLLQAFFVRQRDPN